MLPKFHIDNDFISNPMNIKDISIFQIGEMLCSPSLFVIPHKHLNFYELSYIISGEGDFFTNNISTHVKEGDVYFSMPYEIHKIVSDNANPLRYIFCAFNFNDNKTNNEYKEILTYLNTYYSSATSRTFNNSQLFPVFQNLLSLINNIKETQNKYNKLLFENLFKSVIIKTYLGITKTAEPVYSSPKVNNIENLCFNLVQYIDTNLTKIDNLTSLSEVFSYNYIYLSRCFKRVIGESISDYINNKKLKTSVELLEKNISVSEIAKTLNYSSIYVFSRAFKNKIGCSPQTYKKKLLEESKDQTT